MSLTQWVVTSSLLVPTGFLVASKATRSWRWRGRARPANWNARRMRGNVLPCCVRTESARAWRNYRIVREPTAPVLIADRSYKLQLVELPGPFRIGPPRTILPGMIGNAPFHEVLELVWPGGRWQIAATPDVTARLTTLVAELNSQLGFDDTDLLDAVLPAPVEPITAQDAHIGFGSSAHRRPSRIGTWSTASPRNARVLATAFTVLWAAAFALEELGLARLVRFPDFIYFVTSFAMISGVWGSVTYSRVVRRSIPPQQDEDTTDTS